MRKMVIGQVKNRPIFSNSGLFRLVLFVKENITIACGIGEVGYRGFHPNVVG